VSSSSGDIPGDHSLSLFISLANKTQTSLPGNGTQIPAPSAQDCPASVHSSLGSIVVTGAVVVVTGAVVVVTGAVVVVTGAAVVVTGAVVVMGTVVVVTGAVVVVTGAAVVVMGTVVVVTGAVVVVTGASVVVTGAVVVVTGILVVPRSWVSGSSVQFDLDSRELFPSWLPDISVLFDPGPSKSPDLSGRFLFFLFFLFLRRAARLCALISAVLGESVGLLESGLWDMSEPELTVSSVLFDLSSSSIETSESMLSELSDLFGLSMSKA